MIFLLDYSRGLARHEIVPSSWPRESPRKKKELLCGGYFKRRQKTEKTSMRNTIRSVPFGQNNSL